MSICFLYPGQGAQYKGMGMDMHRHSRRVRDLFVNASDVVGFDVHALLTNGDEQELRRTDRTQILITTVSLAAHALLHEYGVHSAAAAGFSVGEYAALVDAGVISSQDAFGIVYQRGIIMEEVSRELDSAEGSPGMLAVLGMEYPDLSAILEQADIRNTYCSMYNSPVQTVISGTASGLDKVADLLSAHKGVRTVPLKVSGPFHCPLMQEAGRRFQDVLSTVQFSDPLKPVYSNVTGRACNTGAELKTLCAEQLLSPVLWVSEEQNIQTEGYSILYEVGPGTVLAGLWRTLAKHWKQAADTQVQAAGTVETIQKLIKEQKLTKGE